MEDANDRIVCEDHHASTTMASLAPAIKYGLYLLPYATTYAYLIYMRNLLISVVRAMTPSWMAALEPSPERV